MASSNKNHGVDVAIHTDTHTGLKKCKLLMGWPQRCVVGYGIQFEDPDSDVAQVISEAVDDAIDKSSAMIEHAKSEQLKIKYGDIMTNPSKRWLWSREQLPDGSTQVWTHILTEEELAYFLTRDVKLNDLHGTVDYNWLEKRLFFPLHRLEIHKDNSAKGFVANVYESTESAAAVIQGLYQTNYNIKDRKGEDLIELYKSVCQEINAVYDQYHKQCKEVLCK